MRIEILHFMFDDVPSTIDSKFFEYPNVAFSQLFESSTHTVQYAAPEKMNWFEIVFSLRSHFVHS